MVAILRILLIHELRMAMRQGSAIGVSIAFFVVVVSLFPLALGPEEGTLNSIGAGVIWVAALLSTLISLERIFAMDFEDGYLDQAYLHGGSMALLVIAKILAHWLISLAPLILVSPVLAMMMALSTDATIILVVSLLIGTPALSAIGAVGAAITTMVKRGNIVLSLLMLPLYTPTLIFAVLAVDAVSVGQLASPHLLLLGAVSLISFAVGPIAARAAIKLALE